MNKTGIKIFALIVLIFWVTVGIVDYYQIKNLQHPFAAFPQIVDQNGKTLYLGMGFSFLITEEDGVISEAEMYILGVRVVRSEAD